MDLTRLGTSSQWFSGKTSRLDHLCVCVCVCVCVGVSLSLVSFPPSSRVATCVRVRVCELECSWRFQLTSNSSHVIKSTDRETLTEREREREKARERESKEEKQNKYLRLKCFMTHLHIIGNTCICLKKQKGKTSWAEWQKYNQLTV